MSKPSETSTSLNKPVFVNISDLSPGTHGHNIYARVMDVKQILDKTSRDGNRIIINEALIADNTGCILLTIRNEQIKLVSKDCNITVRNAKIEMFKNHMRLAVDKWGLIEPTTDNSHTFKPDQVNTKTNLSDTEYELVNVE